MANQVGTATNFEDLFSKIVTFLTTDATLVGAGQQWIVNRIYRDNLESITTSLVENTGSIVARKINHSFRYDSRSLNINDETDSAESFTLCTSFVAGTSNIDIALKTAAEAKYVYLRAINASSNLNYMLKNFRLQYSDNAISWTTALTVNTNPIYTQNEIKLFTIPGSVGNHKYWRIIADSRQDSGTSGSLSWGSLLLLDSSNVPINHFGSEVLLKAFGNAGTDEIFVGIRSEYSTTDGWYNLFLNGYTGYDANEKSWFNQPGALNNSNMPYPLSVPMVPCWNSTMPYWFSATGRAFKFTLKVSTSYESGYLGFIIPYASPSQYPYPLAIGGSLVPTNALRGVEWRYSYSSNLHSVYTIPSAGVNLPTMDQENTDSTLYLKLPSGDWGAIGQRTGPSALTSMNVSNDFPLTMSGLKRGVWPTSTRSATGYAKDYRDVLGGGYMIQPHILHQRWPTICVYGELDGVYSISGFSNSAENTTVYDGKTNVIFQNVTRTEIHEYWTLALEN